MIARLLILSAILVGANFAQTISFQTSNIRPNTQCIQSAWNTSSVAPSVLRYGTATGNYTTTVDRTPGSTSDALCRCVRPFTGHRLFLGALQRRIRWHLHQRVQRHNGGTRDDGAYGGNGR